jgi:hypothetical protein
MKIKNKGTTIWCTKEDKTRLKKISKKYNCKEIQLVRIWMNEEEKKIKRGVKNVI